MVVNANLARGAGERSRYPYACVCRRPAPPARWWQADRLASSTTIRPLPLCCPCLAPLPQWRWRSRGCWSSAWMRCRTWVRRVRRQECSPRSTRMPCVERFPVDLPDLLCGPPCMPRPTLPARAAGAMDILCCDKTGTLTMDQAGGGGAAAGRQRHRGRPSLHIRSRAATVPPAPPPPPPRAAGRTDVVAGLAGAAEQGHAALGFPQRLLSVRPALAAGCSHPAVGCVGGGRQCPGGMLWRPPSRGTRLLSDPPPASAAPPPPHTQPQGMRRG